MTDHSSTFLNVDVVSIIPTQTSKIIYLIYVTLFKDGGDTSIAVLHRAFFHSMLLNLIEIFLHNNVVFSVFSSFFSAAFLMYMHVIRCCFNSV